MIENEIAKLEKPDQDRLSSCLYPSLASSCVVGREVGLRPWWRLTWALLR